MLQGRTCLKLYGNTAMGLAKLVMSCSCSFHNFSLIFCGSRLKIWDWSCMLSFQVFSTMISLIYNPSHKGISQVSRMARFWRERILERHRKRERNKVWNSYIVSVTPTACQIGKAWFIDVKHHPWWVDFWLGDGVGFE